MAFNTNKGGPGQESVVSTEDVSDMIGHWVETPVYGYLGEDYGSDPKAPLQQPLAELYGDRYLAKLRADVKVVDILPRNQVNLYAQNIYPDKKQIFIEVGNIQIPVEE